MSYVDNHSIVKKLMDMYYKMIIVIHNLENVDKLCIFCHFSKEMRVKKIHDLLYDPSTYAKCNTSSFGISLDGLVRLF